MSSCLFQKVRSHRLRCVALCCSGTRHHTATRCTTSGVNEPKFDRSWQYNEVQLSVDVVLVGSSASGSSQSQGGATGRSGSAGSCHKPSLICAEDISEHCSLIGTHHYSLNGRAAAAAAAAAATGDSVPQLLSSQHAPSVVPTPGLYTAVDGIQ